MCEYFCNLHSTSFLKYLSGDIKALSEHKTSLKIRLNSFNILQIYGHYLYIIKAMHILKTEFRTECYGCMVIFFDSDYYFFYHVTSLESLCKDIRQLIQQRCRIKMPIRTVGEYLKRWGFTIRKPVKRAYEQNPKEVNQWLQEHYPVIAAQAKKEKAELYWGDETGLQTAAHQARGFAPKGKRPILRISARKSSISMVSAINNEGQMRFMLYKKGMTAKLLIKFIGRLIRDAKRKVYLILDNLRPHHSKEVKEWVQKHQEEIALYYLPSYSPELNPDEYLNNDLKGRVHAGVPSRSEQELRTRVLSHMRSIAKRPYHVKKFFEHPSVAYAA